MRKATLQTLQTLTSLEKGNDGRKKERWGEGGSAVLQFALRHIYQRILIEHVESIQEVAERVWENLVVNSDLELLLHASCPYVSTWLCLAMQSESLPFNPSVLVNSPLTVKPAKFNHTSNNCDVVQADASAAGGNSNSCAKPQSELKVYIGGIETVSLSARQMNVVRARCMASRTLGLLSRFVIQPAPGAVYTANIPSPALCYAKVLLAHLESQSALQRTVVGLVMSHWATLEYPVTPAIPDILR